jgi:hypothetical protein
MICKRLEDEFPNISYFRQDSNIGSTENFHFLLSNVTSAYFMFLGSHDLVSPNFIPELKHRLELDRSAAVAMGSLFFSDPFGTNDGHSEDVRFNSWRNGEIEEVVERVRATIFDDVNLSWVMYGLYRTEILKRFFTRDLPIVGGDNVFLCKVSTAGKIVVSNKAHYFAWTRPKDSGEEYVFRATADPVIRKSYAQLRGQMRLQIYNILVSTLQSPSLVWQNFLRLQVMCRYGPFRTCSWDVVFFIFFVPVKLCAEIRRIRRRLGASKS